MNMTIQQAAKFLNVHKDTLRRWEKKKHLVPKRSGKRGDRLYDYNELVALKKTLEINECIKSPEWNMKLTEYSKLYKKGVIEFLSKLVETPSVNGEDPERDIVNVIYKKCEELGLPVKIVGKDMDRPNIFVGKGFDSDKSMVFVAHLDTVAAGNDQDWKYPPFKATKVNNRLYGRGASDCKAGIATSIYALKILNDIGFSKVAKFVGGSDEETGAQSDIGIIYVLQKGLKASSAIYTYPGHDQIGIGSRGLIRMVVKCKGEQVHTGLKDWTLGIKGLNAIDGLRLFISEVEKLPMGNSHEVFGKLTSKMTVTKFNAGIGESIVPPFAECLIDIRLMPNFDSNRYIKRVRKIARKLEKFYGYNFSIFVKNNGPAWIIDRRLAIVNVLESLTKEYFGINPVLKGRGPFNEGGFLTENGIPTIGGYGIEGGNVHGIDEYCELDEVPKMLEIYVKTALLMYNKQNASVAQLDRAAQS